MKHWEDEAKRQVSGHPKPFFQQSFTLIFLLDFVSETSAFKVCREKHLIERFRGVLLATTRHPGLNSPLQNQPPPSLPVIGRLALKHLQR